MSQREITVDPVTIGFLEQCEVKDNIVYLPNLRLSTKQYSSVNTVLEAIGGKWNRKAKGHLFEVDPTGPLDDVLTTGQVAKPNGLEFFPTPKLVADQVVRLAQLEPDLSVLEPSAGAGALAVAAAEVVGYRCVHCIEIQERFRPQLEGYGFIVQTADFLTVNPTPYAYDRVVMNPPFSRQQDIDHVLHARKFLAPDGRLVAVMSASVMFRENRKTVEFREHIVDSWANPARSFRESGTDVNTVTVVLEAKR